jgi:uncharacterized protein (TIGR02466 family)
MQITRQDWWATPIWYIDIPETQINPNLIKEECYKEQLNSKGRIKSNIHGWQSEDIFIDQKRPYISNLLTQIKSIIPEISKDFGINKDIELTNTWININPKNSSNQFHIHPNSVLSGVYYVSANEHNGDLIFYNDAKTDMINNIFLNVNTINTCSNINYKPTTNRIILFPSWILHGVGINNSSEDRISIAFNFDIKRT